MATVLQFWPRGRRPTGFTLVELLVVIAIIGILVSLLLPAVQAAREAARRTQCSNNLKQIGIAFQNYHTAKGQFPPGWTEDDGPSRPDRKNNFAWGTHILPFVEEQSIYDQFDFTRAASSGTPGDDRVENIDLIGSNLTIFRCPSDTPDSDFGSFAEYGAFNPEIPAIAISNYVGSGSICQPCHFGWYVAGQTDPSGCPFGITGVLYRDSDTNLGKITDGSTHTFLVGERKFGGSGNGPYWAGLPGPSSNQTACWAGLVTAHLRSLHQSTLPMINGHWIGFSSHHPAGVQVVLCDGAVKFVNEAIQMFPLASMIQIQDGNVVEQDTP